MNYWLWGGGALAAGGLLYLVARGGSDNGKTSESAAKTPQVQPLMMSGGGNAGGGQAGLGNANLGGDAWEPPTVPLSENPDVAIANITAGVQLAAINAAKELQLAGLATLPGAESTVPPVDTSGSSTSEWRGSNIVAGAEFAKNVLAEAPVIGSEAVENKIFSAAKAAGYSATEVAQSLSAAAGKTVKPEEVNKWLSDRGLKL